MTNDTAPFSSRRILVAAVLFTACWLVSRAELSAAQLGLGKLFGDKGVTYRTFRDPAGRFEFEYPTKDWRELSSATANLAMLARNDGATVAIDFSRMALARPLTSDIAYGTLADVEIDSLKERHPQAKEFKSEIIETRGGRGALIRYATVGTKGPERIMQYSIPVGLDLYRVIAIVPEMLLAKHEAVLMHMIESFRAPAAEAPSKN
jgi:hypothetical protein